VSKSKRRSSSTQPTAPANAPEPTHPWVIGDIDFGPAVAAAHDLAAWAFDLAARDVADWPEGRRRVRNARRFVLLRLRGKDVHRTPYEDVLFTAGLLARILEADLHLPLVHVVAALDHLGLPTEVVPLVSHPQRRGAAMYPSSPISPLRPRPAAGAVAPAPVDVCDECGLWCPRYRNAA
jgi:hypothetical protein